jgi:hypothetical protein
LKIRRSCLFLISIRQKDNTKSQDYAADGDGGISDIPNRPDLEVQKISDVPDVKSIDKVASGTTEDKAQADPDRDTVEKRPAAAQDKYKSDQHQYAYGIKDGKDEGMPLKKAKSDPGIFHTDDLEKANIEERFAGRQMRPYPPLSDLVKNNNTGDNNGEYYITPANAEERL